MRARIGGLLAQPWLFSFLGAFAVWIAAVAYTGGRGAGGMVSAGIALAAFAAIVGTAQMFVVTLGPGNVDLSLPANIGLASAVAMKVMGGSNAWILGGLASAVAVGMAIGFANYVLIRSLRIPPIIATLSASFVIQSIGISYGRGLQIKPPPGFAAATSAQVAGVSLLALTAAGFKRADRAAPPSHGLRAIRRGDRPECSGGTPRQCAGRTHPPRDLRPQRCLGAG